MIEKNNIESDFVFVQIDSELTKNFAPSWTHDLLSQKERKATLDKTDEFINEARSYDRNDLLGLTGLYSLRGGFLSPGKENPYPETVDIEFLQMITLGEAGEKRPRIPRERVSGFWRELRSQVFVLGHTSEVELTGLESLAKTHNAYYRNSYGDNFFDLMIRNISAEYDLRYVRNKFIKNCGEALVIIRKELMGRAKEYIERLRIVATAERLEKIEVVNKYFDSDLHADLEDYSDQGLLAVLFDILDDIAIEKDFLLEEEWISQHEIAGYPMRHVLETLSIPDTAATMGFANILLVNPIWSQPFLKTPEGFLLFSVVTLMSFPFSILMTIIGGGDKEKLNLEKVRGSFVEQQLYEILTMKLPSASIIRGGFWKRENGDRVETDLIVFLAGRLLIFEAKGALIPDRAKLGKKDAIRHYLKRVWGKSTLQGVELERRVRESDCIIEITDSKDVLQFSLNPLNVVTISRYSISIEQIGIFMNAPNFLMKEGVLEEGISPAPCIILSELNIILNGLFEEEARFHYFSRRGKFSKSKDFVGDELDFFSTYIQFGFTDIPDDNSTLMLLGSSFSLQTLINDDGHYVIPNQSALLNSPYFKSVLESMKDKNSACYQYVSLILIDFPLKDQLIFEESLNKIFHNDNFFDENCLLYCHVKSLVANFIVAGIVFDDSLSGAEMRFVANRFLDETIQEEESEEGFVLVRIKGSTNVYDAVYYYAPKFKKTIAN